jgi:O-antigen ligase
VIFDQAHYGPIGHQLLLLITGIALMLFASTVSMNVMRVGMVVFIIALLINLIFMEFTMYSRMTGFFRNPNHFGFSLGIAALYLANYSTVKNSHRMLKIASLIVIFVGIFLTGSRSALIGLLVVMPLISLYKNGLKSLVLGMVILLILGALYSLVLQDIDAFNLIADRYSGSELTRAGNRTQLSMAALNLGSDTGFLGVGVDQFRSMYYFDLVDRLDFLHDKYGIPLGIHNFYLQLLVEWGVLSFILMAIFILFLLKRLGKSNCGLVLFAKSIILYFLLVAFTADITQYVSFWLALGLTIAIIRSETLVKRQNANL